MGSVVDAHINQLLSLGGAAEGSLAHMLRLPYKSNYGSVGGLARIYVKHLDIPLRGYCGDYCVYHRTVASLTEIRNAFDYSFHFVISSAY